MASNQLDQNGSYSDKMLHVDTFGKPKILPRIGFEYQAELPQFLGDSNSSSRPSRHSADDETRADLEQNYLLGLPIKLMWTSNVRKSPEESENVPALNTTRDSYMVPGVCGEPWSTAEKDYFLLGLYIFAKNFIAVRKFVGTKEMGALLSYYYGKFYSSPEHHRWSWSNIRRLRNKKFRFGKRMFTGVGLQELLSRLAAIGSRQNAVLENKKISVENFIFALKEMVSADILLEALGIGRAKQDPIVLSSLASNEIINLLNGKRRLTKARSNELFWKAVWPRLQANGWHSEQPASHTQISEFSPSQVFLAPGIKKFSRKLVRGDHYFDSIIDVLSKIALEPCLLELEPKEVACSNEAEESERIDEGESLMRPPVVEAGLSDGNIIHLRTLPYEADSIHTITHDASEADDQPSQESLLSPTTSLGHSFQERVDQPHDEITSSNPDGDRVEETDMQGGEWEQSNSHPRRFSTRNWNPTTRVLDCLAHTRPRPRPRPRSRQKRKEGSPHEDRRASQQARGESNSNAAANEAGK